MSGTSPRRWVARSLMAALLAGSMLSSGYAVYLARDHAAAAEGLPAVQAPIMRQPGGMPSFADLAARAKPAVVNIATTERKPVGAMPELPQLPPGSPFDELFKRFFEEGGQGVTGPVHALGSGFIVDPDGWIVTNNHVVDSATKITITLNDGRTFPATVKGRDEKTDIAVLKIDAKTPLPALEFGDSDAVRVGDWVVAIGNPFGLGGTVTAGIASARSRDINSGPFDDFLQIDAPINRGNSGGPLFDQSGRVIGINTAIFSPNGGSVGIGFAIPSNIASEVVTQLREHGKIERGWLGVEMQGITPALAQAMHRPDSSGALVDSVVDDSPASAAGLQPGDVITGFNGHAIKSPRDLAREVAAQKEGRVSIEAWRSGSTLALTASLRPMPTDFEKAETSNGTSDGGSVGVAMAPLTAETRAALGLDQKVRGVAVTGVRPGSPAEEGGLQQGDVIVGVAGKPVSSPRAASRAMHHALDQNKAVALRVLRNGHAAFLAIEPAQS